jgi:hypothetical protein
MEAIVVGKVHHAPHKLGAATVVFRPIVEIDHQGGEVSKALAHRLPPPGDTVGQAVAGDLGADTIEKDFIEGGHQDTHWSYGGVGLEIVISALGRDTAFAPTRKRANFDRGLGIKGNAQSIGGPIGIVIDLIQTREDGVGLRDFF